MAAGADTPVTVQVQSGVAPLEADLQKEVAKVESQAAKAEHGLPQAAVPVLNKLGRLPITNSMVVTWIVAVGLIVFAQVATRKMQRGSRRRAELLGMAGGERSTSFLEGIIGPDLVKRTFWFFATIFIFILFTNWFGLIPGVGTIGWGVPDRARVRDRPARCSRGGNADLNMTLAMAMIFFACWIVWALQAVGVKGVFLDLFGPKGDTTGVLKVLMIVVFFAGRLPGGAVDPVPARSR